MLRTMKRFTALSLGTIEPEASQNTRFTCWFRVFRRGERRVEGWTRVSRPRVLLVAAIRRYARVKGTRRSRCHRHRKAEREPQRTRRRERRRRRRRKTSASRDVPMATLNHVRFRAPPESARGGRMRQRAAAHARARQSLTCQGTRRARCPLRASRRVALGPARSPRRPARRSKNPSGSGSVARAIAVGGNSRGRGTHVTTRAGGLVATIRASLLRHGVCLGPARSSVP